MVSLSLTNQANTRKSLEETLVNPSIFMCDTGKHGATLPNSFGADYALKYQHVVC